MKPGSGGAAPTALTSALSGPGFALDTTSCQGRTKSGPPAPVERWTTPASANRVTGSCGSASPWATSWVVGLHETRRAPAGARRWATQSRRSAVRRAGWIFLRPMWPAIGHPCPRAIARVPLAEGPGSDGFPLTTAADPPPSPHPPFTAAVDVRGCEPRSAAIRGRSLPDRAVRAFLSAHAQGRDGGRGDLLVSGVCG